MEWIKRGLIYEPSKDFFWNQSYAILPTPEWIPEKNLIRVYFGTTDLSKNSRITYLDLDEDDITKIIYIADNFILNLGSAGMFDDSGVVPSSLVVDKNGNKSLYYVGFQRCEKVPYMIFSGLSKNENNLSLWERVSEVPIICRNDVAPCSNGAPFVINDNGIYRMWFWLGKKWIDINSKAYINAEIGYAESKNGLDWEIVESSCIEPTYGVEFSVGRPWVVKEAGKYRMFYSIRYVDKLYRLGYAESDNGILWERKDDLLKLDVSVSGWDSEMVCYPSVITVKDKTYLFYNGNGNGATGFGVAELFKW